jgi:sugar/nucleoside kinase (ribokinase family)
MNITDQEVVSIFDGNGGFGEGDVLVVQNEINCTRKAIELAHQRRMVIVANPAPCPPDVLQQLPLELATILIVNEGEASSLVRQLVTSETADKVKTPEELVHVFMTCLSQELKAVVITLGSRGLVAGFVNPDESLTPRAYDMYRLPVFPNIKPADTTGAGASLSRLSMVSIS